MWISRAEYRRLLRQLDRAEQRADGAATELANERKEHYRMVVHLTNALLRSKAIGAFPMPEKAPAELPGELEPAALTLDQLMDPGEIEALVETGAQHGLDRASVLRMLEEEKGLK